MTAGQSPREAKALSTQRGSSLSSGSRIADRTACFVLSGWRDPIRIRRECQVVFVLRKKGSTAAENENPVTSGKIAPGVLEAISGRYEQSFHFRFLGCSDFHGDHTARIEMRVRASSDRPVGLKPVRTAVKRAC